MANTLNAYTKVSMENFPQLRQAAARLNRYSKDFSADIVDSGTAVTVGYEGSFSASLWTAASNYTTTDSTESSTQVTMREPFHVEIYLTPNEKRAYGEGKLTGRVAGPAAGVFNEIKKQALAVLATAATANVATLSASAFTFSTVLSGSTVLADSGSQGAQSFLAPRTVYNALISDAKANNYQIAVVAQDGSEVMTYALLPNVQIVPEPGLSAPIICTQDAVAIATALPEQQPGHNRTVITDEGKTEATIAVDVFQDGVAGKTKLRAQVMAGVASGRPGCAAKYTLL